MGMWYVIQVLTGKEEEMRYVIEKVLPRQLYEDCFYIKRERIWRRDGQCILHVERLFPGYLFISTENPLNVYEELKKSPGFTKLLKCEGDVFLAVSKEEQVFLTNLINGDEEYVVRLSKVQLNEAKEIISAEGGLRHYVDRIVKKKLRLRYVIIEMKLFEKKRDILIGIEV